MPDIFFGPVVSIFFLYYFCVLTILTIYLIDTNIISNMFKLTNVAIICICSIYIDLSRLESVDECSLFVSTLVNSKLRQNHTQPVVCSLV